MLYVIVAILFVVSTQAWFARRSLVKVHERIDTYFSEILARFEEICRQLSEIRGRLGPAKPQRVSRSPRRRLFLQQIPASEAMRIRQMINRDLQPPKRGGPKRFRRGR